MVFGRKRRRDGQGGRRAGRDPFKQMATDRRATEDETPWFLAEDTAEDLEIEAGRSARMEE